MLQLVLLVKILICLLNFGRASLCFFDGGQTVTVPLKALHVQGEFFDSFGEVFVRQVWRNSHVNPITSKYKFSLDNNAVISGFEMKIGNKSWTGVVKAKSIAREQFDQAVETGTKSSLLEKISDNEYQVEIGPIPPDETAEIDFRYLTHAAVQLDGSYRFVLPTNIAPKYIDLSSATNKIDKEYADKMASTPYSSQPPYTFDVDLTWHTGSALRGIVSPTNEIHSELLSATAVRVRCTTAPEHGDFSLVVTTAATTGAYSYQNDEGTSYLYVHSQIPTEVIPSSVSAKKITIVVDRSGSMAWQKIREAVAAMDKFLSLLPPNANTLINVVSFGSHFDALYSHSVPATASNIEVIRQRVRTFDADYGGTELSECLRAVVVGRALPSGTASAPQPEPSNMEHVIVLLTDGQVYNVHEITNDLTAQKTTTSFRIMSVGIGRDADRKLVQQVADTTHGLSRMLVDETDLTRALTDTLTYIDKQYYTDVRVLDYEASQCSQVLYPAHPVDIFLRLSPAQYQQVVANGLTITAKDPLHRGSIKVWHVPVSETHKTGHLLEKLYADHTISQLSKQIEKMDGLANVQHDVAHLTESIVALSVKYGIMNKRTSYLVVSNEQIDAQQLAQVQPVEVQQHVQTSSNGNFANVMVGRAPSSAGFSVPSIFPAVKPVCSSTGSVIPSSMPAIFPLSETSVLPSAVPSIFYPPSAPSELPSAVPSIFYPPSAPSEFPSAVPSVFTFHRHSAIAAGPTSEKFSDPVADSAPSVCHAVHEIHAEPPHCADPSAGARTAGSTGSAVPLEVKTVPSADFLAAVTSDESAAANNPVIKRTDVNSDLSCADHKNISVEILAALQQPDGSLSYTPLAFMYLRYANAEQMVVAANAVDLTPALFFNAAMLLTFETTRVGNEGETERLLLRNYVTSHVSAEELLLVQLTSSLGV